MTPLSSPLAHPLRALVLAAALLAPAAADAAIRLNLAFTGVVSPGAQGSVLVYNEGTSTTSFAGEPMTISLSVLDDNGYFYVDTFAATWSNGAYALPFTTGRSGSGLPYSVANEAIPSFFSTVSLSDTGGSIHIFPTPEFFAFTDGNLQLDINYTLSTPHDPLSVFDDGAVSGGGAFDSYLNFNFDPVLGAFDATSTGTFVLDSLSVTRGVPEPADWALMLLGFAGIGVATRVRRATGCAAT